MKITKALITSMLVAGFATSVLANEKTPQVTLSGSIDTQAGYRDQKQVYDKNSSGNGLHKFAIVNDTTLNVKAVGHAKGFNYGGEIELNADTSANKFSNRGNESRSDSSSFIARKTFVYVDSPYAGRLEAGSTTGAYEKLRVGPSRLAHATGGTSGDWKYWANTQMDGHGVFILNGALPTAMINNDEVANAAKITYYTPKYKGFKAALSFVPDTEQHGTVSLTKSIAKNRTLTTQGGSDVADEAMRTSGFKNVFQGGLLYRGSWDNTHFRFSALGEIGDAKDAFVSPLLTQRHDLRAWEVGASMKHKEFGVAAAYGDFGKSGLFKVSNGTPWTGSKKGNYWTAGASYEHKDFGASLTYLGSKTGGFVDGINYSARKSTLSAYSLGLDYKLAPGFMPYAEVTAFDMKDKSSDPTHKNSGTIMLVGTKLQF